MIPVAETAGHTQFQFGGSDVHELFIVLVGVGGQAVCIHPCFVLSSIPGCP